MGLPSPQTPLEAAKPILGTAAIAGLSEAAMPL